MVMIDPKKVELSHFDGVPHLLTPVVTKPKEASYVLHNICTPDGLSLRTSWRAWQLADIHDLNKKLAASRRAETAVHRIVIDELADLMM